MKEILNTKTEKIRWVRLVAKVAIIAIILWLVFGIFFGLARIEGIAMSPRLEDGDLTLFQRGNKNLNNDDVIIFEQEGKIYTSRIVAKEGEQITLDEDGIMYVEGQQVSQEPIRQEEQGQKIRGFFPIRVPAGRVYLLNDNLSSFEDSRSFGTIDINAIKGRAISILRTRAV